MDSWARYEQQAKEKEQAALAKTVIENVLKTIQDEKTQKDILASAVTEVEREYHLVIGTLPNPVLTVACVLVLQSWSSPRPYRVPTCWLAITCSNLNRPFSCVDDCLRPRILPAVDRFAERAGSTRLDDRCSTPTATRAVWLITTFPSPTPSTLAQYRFNHDRNPWIPTS